MQRLGKTKEEREASEPVLAVGGEKLNPMLAALTLVGLAQLNISEQRFLEAKQQLERAEELDPKNPVVVGVSADLRSKLPKFSAQSQHDVENTQRPPRRDLPLLIEELHDWCRRWPQMREAILPLWFYIHRADLWGIVRSMLGVKFLICTADAAEYAKLKRKFSGQGDLYVWGTHFDLKTKPKPEIIPVPPGFLYPAGITIVTPGRNVSSDAGESRVAKTSGEKILGPATDPTEKPYYLAYLKGVSGFPDGSPLFRREGALAY
jgi:hypothetical protein